MDAPTQLMAGGVPITAPSAQDMQLNILLWGDSGVGKTTLQQQHRARNYLSYLILVGTCLWLTG